MLPTATLATSAVLWFLTALILLSAWWVAALSNLFRAALSLGVVLLGVAALFLFVHAEFLAFVQILVYVGAILTLVVFAIMLTAKLQDPAAPVSGRQQGPAAVVSLAVFGLLAWLVCRWPWPESASPAPVNLQALGRELVTTLVLPFEVISLVFVAAMVGAIALAASPKAPKDAAR